MMTDTKNIYGATVCVRFNANHPQLQQCMNYNHELFGTLPQNLIAIKTHLNNTYESLVPIDFRYVVYNETFEMLGIFKNYKDTIPLLLETLPTLTNLGHEVFVSFGFGTVYIPTKEDMQDLDGDCKRILEYIGSHGVYSAFQVFKRPDLKLNSFPYFFYGYHYDCKNLNISYPAIFKNSLALQEELSELQRTDEQTNRHTYYSNHVF